MLLDEIRSAVHESVRGLIENHQWQSYQGKHSQQLQERLADLLQQSHVDLCSSGTAALEILLRAAGVGAGDEVLLSAYDYPGNFWAIERAGARPVLVDVEPDSWNICFDSLDSARSSECKVLIVSHLHGLIQSVDRLARWCDEHGILMIEDACQSLGAIYDSQPIGSFGHAAVLSFGGGKVLSAGRGGAWLTNNPGLAQKARVAGGAGSGPYTMSELQSAVVLAQLPWLDAVNAVCREYFDALNQTLDASKIDWLQPTTFSLIQSTDILRAYYQAGWILNRHESESGFDSTNDSREALLARLRTADHQLQSALTPPFGFGFPGFHRRSNRRCRIPSKLENTPSVAERTIVLHHSVAVQQHWSVQQLAEWIQNCTSRR